MRAALLLASLCVLGCGKTEGGPPDAQPDARYCHWLIRGPDGGFVDFWCPGDPTETNWPDSKVVCETPAPDCNKCFCERYDLPTLQHDCVTRYPVCPLDATTGP